MSFWRGYFLYSVYSQNVYYIYSLSLTKYCILFNTRRVYLLQISLIIIHTSSFPNPCRQSRDTVTNVNEFFYTVCLKLSRSLAGPFGCGSGLPDVAHLTQWPTGDPSPQWPTGGRASYLSYMYLNYVLVVWFQECTQKFWDPGFVLVSEISGPMQESGVESCTCVSYGYA